MEALDFEAVLQPFLKSDRELRIGIKKIENIDSLYWH